MPAAGQPQSRTGRSRDLRAVSLPADRRHQAEGHRRAREVRRADAAADARPDFPAARPRVRVSGRQTRSDVPPRVPAAQPLVEARGVGGHVAGTIAPSNLLISVAVPVPGLDLLTYSVPDGAGAPPIGARVVVPLGGRSVTGLVVGHGASADGHAVKPIKEVLDRESFVPPDLIALARWTADYYACGVGDAIPSLLPPMARGARADAHKTMRIAAITAAGQEALTATDGTRGFQPSGKQHEALALLAGAAMGIPTP